MPPCLDDRWFAGGGRSEICELHAQDVVAEPFGENHGSGDFYVKLLGDLPIMQSPAVLTIAVSPTIRSCTPSRRFLAPPVDPIAAGCRKVAMPFVTAD